MMIELLTLFYFIFFFVTNITLFKICNMVMDQTRFDRKILLFVAFINALIFTIIIYGFNQLPTVTYLMVLFGCIIEMRILFKNNIWGILMYSFITTIYLVCIESVVISSGALLLGLTLGELTHNHILLTTHIVLSWFVMMLVSLCVHRFVPGRYLRIINQNKDQVFYILCFLAMATIYLTLNSFIYGYARFFESSYLPIHQVITPLTWFGVVNLSIALLIHTNYLQGYKTKSDVLQRTVDMQKSEIIENKIKAERDSLVNAYNRTATETKIIEALDEVQHGAFFVVDVDDFKNINDTHGHPFGDKVLMYISKRITSTFREHDIVGRFGGDEFVVFLKNAPTVEMVKGKAKELCRDINVPFSDGIGSSSQITISIGIALFPQHGKDFDILYQRADNALYQSKSKGKNTYSLYKE